jgi:DNA-binding response OmpR family regulator
VTKALALIIEDDIKLADIFSIALREEFEVEVAQDGNTALARLAELIPALVVLDLHLPHVSGEKILQQIRLDGRLVQTQVIVATADARTAEYLQTEVDLVLLKPISINQLRDLALRLHPPDTL